MRKIVRVCSFLTIAAALHACSDSASNGGGNDTQGTTDDATGDDTADTAPETVSFDTGTPDSAPPEVVVSADFGEPCNGNADCESGWCVESPTGYICTEQCLEECPSGYDCKSVQLAQGDVTFLCLPRVQKLCIPCLEDFQCNTGACLALAGGTFCASDCDSDDDCPDGYGCRADASATHTGSFCQPLSGSCDCSPPFAGVTRTCTTTNAIGTCIGIETCDPAVGWVGCTAREATGETCDYIDNNCDGGVDEEFQTDGIYASQTGCGSCTTSCDVVLPNALETECFVEDGLARCRVVSCKPGYVMINPYVCAPDVGNVCQSCQADAECLGDGAACTTLNDGSFCTGPCLDDNDCADGFVCQATGAPEKQCVPASGSCTCDGSNTDLARACSVTLTPDDPDAPVVICKGFEQCTADGWGECDLPDDACDGIDNDCDGVIDGPHKTGDKYTSLEHCGSCEISCLAFVRPNAQPVCDAAPAVPTCTYRCTGDAVDVNGRSDDGCECLPVAGADLAGDDVDSNCDGVDGEVDNAIFVSKDGSDTNPGTIDLPVLTIQTGLTKASQQNKRDVYVATGVYSQNLVLVDGVGLFGGYAPDFFQHDVLLFETAIIGESPTAQNIGAITAQNLGAAGAQRETVLDGFTIFGINAGNLEGGNSYAVYVRNGGTKLRITHNQIFGGPGGNGKNGTRGSDGSNGVDGANGANAKSLSNNCTSGNESNGGAGGSRTCGAVNVSGGGGGRSNCPDYENAPGSTANGTDGNGPDAGDGGAYGWPLFICANQSGCSDIFEYSLGCGLCYVPMNSKPSNATNGTNGATGANGARGSAGASGGSATSGQWVGNKGGDGGAGSNGSGGGGGGAGGGVEVSGTSCTNTGNDDVAGSGGGGGSGGCLGTGGTGGLGGGGSFGIFVLGSDLAHTPRIADNTVIAGRGGNGGAGGAGGVGGELGKGGSGGVAGDGLATADERDETRCARAGGDGGNGGSGGHGGGGGGGAGGPSYGLFVSLPVAPPGSWKNENDFVAGQGGAGGAGGVSVDQTRSGQNGANGTAASTSF